MVRLNIISKNKRFNTVHKNPIIITQWFPESISNHDVLHQETSPLHRTYCTEPVKGQSYAHVLISKSLLFQTCLLSTSTNWLRNFLSSLYRFRYSIRHFSSTSMTTGHGTMAATPLQACWSSSLPCMCVMR